MYKNFYCDVVFYIFNVLGLRCFVGLVICLFSGIKLIEGLLKYLKIFCMLKVYKRNGLIYEKKFVNNIVLKFENICNVLNNWI